MKKKIYKIINNRNGHSFNMGDKVHILIDRKMRSSTVPGEYYYLCRRIDGYEPGGNCVLINDMKLIKDNINTRYD